MMTGSERRSRWREWGGRLGMLLGGLVVGLVLLEGALRAGALVVRVTGRPLPTTFATDGRRVLSTGDSNTYGIYLKGAAQPYPSVFERLWNARHPDRPVEVVNVAYPGTNSSRLRNALPRFLAAAKPDVVTIMAGTNDFWTEPESLAPNAEGSAYGGPSWLWRHSRVYRLLFMARRSAEFTLERVEVFDRTGGGFPKGESATFRTAEGTIDLGWDERRSAPGDVLGEARRNLVAITDIVRRHGAEPVFVTYPCEIGFYGSANTLMREAAGQSGTRLIDVGAALRTRCSDGDCPDVFLPDCHPTALGHEMAAEILADRWEAAGS